MNSGGKEILFFGGEGGRGAGGWRGGEGKGSGPKTQTLPPPQKKNEIKINQA